jgi:hypothetical protein
MFRRRARNVNLIQPNPPQLKSKDMAIERTLALSTSHITEASSQALGAIAKHYMRATCGSEIPLPAFPVRVAEHGYGWILFLTDELPTPEAFYPYSEIHRLVEFALINGCKTINLDQDADEANDLPTFDW